ncbi:hypothetical protein C5167_024802 [Papaver somniferum]|uniref:Uncharacterized protein n=1 Tax=Papaver somniferum TaxID=3469 RepID=A0A4Y7JSL4_PAPSO|nr:hypothetical protein C5167_024802 [Papaver somniferum]
MQLADHISLHLYFGTRRCLPFVDQLEYLQSYLSPKREFNSSLQTTKSKLWRLILLAFVGPLFIPHHCLT